MKKLLQMIKRHKRDAIVISSLLIVGVFFLFILNIFGASGTTVSVSIDGRHIADYSLYLDGEYEIGDGNVLTVSDGAAYMSYADCPDKTCKNMGKISLVGEKIICLPNKVIIEIR